MGNKKQKKNLYVAVAATKQAAKPVPPQKTAPSAASKSQPTPPKPSRKSGGLALGLELILAALCVGAWIWFFTRRTCAWDVPLLILWAAIALGAAILLLRGERRLAAARRGRSVPDGT